MRSFFPKVILLLISYQSVSADTLIRMDRVRIYGKLSVIGDTYVEFVEKKGTNGQQWIKVFKKDILAILDGRGKLLYPRDKYDEVALNYGKVKLRTAQDVSKYKQRKSQYIQAQAQHEKREKKHYKIAAFIGGVSGLMAYTFIRASQ